jgi:DNA repair photolyase
MGGSNRRTGRIGGFTTFKSNAPELLRKALRPDQRIYCSPLVDPYQPAEASAPLMPRILEALIHHPPRVFTLQTRGPLVLRDLPLRLKLAGRTIVRVSFSITVAVNSACAWRSAAPGHACCDNFSPRTCGW